MGGKHSRCRREQSKRSRTEESCPCPEKGSNYLQHSADRQGALIHSNFVSVGKACSQFPRDQDSLVSRGMPIETLLFVKVTLLQLEIVERVR